MLRGFDGSWIVPLLSLTHKEDCALLGEGRADYGCHSGILVSWFFGRTKSAEFTWMIELNGFCIEIGMFCG